MLGCRLWTSQYARKGGKLSWAAIKNQMRVNEKKTPGRGKVPRVEYLACRWFKSSYLVDPASSHMLVSKIKPCMSKYKQICTVKLRMAH